MASGTFVTVSGVDGSGKSTLVAALAARARTLGRWTDVVTLRPLQGDPELVRRVRRLSTPDPAWPVRERWLAGYFGVLLLDAAERLVLPAVRDGALVVTDRWVVDHLVNQSYFGVDLTEWVPVLERLPAPDLALWVDVPADVAGVRVSARTRPGVGAGEPFLRHAVARFAELAAPTHERVDGTAPPERTAEECLARMLVQQSEGAA
ncbi:hypothetical protein ACN28C_28205 [Plantactinospora sp. WMMC1484]|uniref:hypothetical protein n=1 Tax=Plantactinospora sp. WMMC1484 TaxID=3404122 RepID=UPI003BF57BC4